MTLDEFLDDYVPRVLKPLGGWRLTPTRMIRKDNQRGKRACCPLTAERGLPSNRWCSEAERLDVQMATWIIDAADHRFRKGYDGDDRIGKLRAVRARLLAGLGLSEGR